MQCAIPEHESSDPASHAMSAVELRPAQVDQAPTWRPHCGHVAGDQGRSAQQRCSRLGDTASTNQMPTVLSKMEFASVRSRCDRSLPRDEFADPRASTSRDCSVSRRPRRHQANPWAAPEVSRQMLSASAVIDDRRSAGRVAALTVSVVSREALWSSGPSHRRDRS